MNISDNSYLFPITLQGLRIAIRALRLAAQVAAIHEKEVIQEHYELADYLEAHLNEAIIKLREADATRQKNKQATIDQLRRRHFTN